MYFKNRPVLAIALAMGASLTPIVANVAAQAQASPAKSTKSLTPAEKRKAAADKKKADALAVGAAKKEAAAKAALPPPFVAPADPSTKEGENEMVAKKDYLVSYNDTQKSYDENKPQGEASLKPYAEKTAADWLTAAATAFKENAAQFRKLAKESKPGLGTPKTPEEVTIAYSRNGKLVQAEWQAAHDSIAAVNLLAPEFKKFFEDAALKLESAHKDATALRTLLKSPLFVDMDGVAEFSSTGKLLPSNANIASEKAAKQLDNFVAYLDELHKTPGAMPSLKGKILNFSKHEAGMKADGPFVSSDLAANIRKAADSIIGALVRFEKYTKQNGFTTATPTSETTYVVSPFGERGSVSGFVTKFEMG